MLLLLLPAGVCSALVSGLMSWRLFFMRSVSRPNCKLIANAGRVREGERERGKRGKWRREEAERRGRRGRKKGKKRGEEKRS